jgi:hypothetical protein
LLATDIVLLALLTQNTTSNQAIATATQDISLTSTVSALKNVVPTRSMMLPLALVFAIKD